MGVNLSVHKNPTGFRVVLDAGIPGEMTVAKCIPQEFMARQFSAAPTLIDAAAFAASVIRTNGMFELSEKMAYERLVAALAIAGVTVDSPAIRELEERAGGVAEAAHG